jgi:hypothetical protein
VISEFAHVVSIRVLELVSERIWHFHRKEQTEMTDFIGD